MAVALPWIQGALGVASLVQMLQGPPTSSMPEKPPTLSWDEAMQRATQTLTPVYDEQMEDTLANVDRELIGRGFFGQLPGATLTGARATDVERAKAAAIAALAGQMQGQSEQNALAQQNLATQWALNNTQMWNQTQSQRIQGLGNLFNLSLQYPLQYAEVTGAMPGGALTPKTQAQLAQSAGASYGGAGAAPTLLGRTPSIRSLASPSITPQRDYTSLVVSPMRLNRIDPWM